MRKSILFILPILFFISCTNDDTFPKTENITKGKKWNLQIGSTPAEVYSQLQELGIQKDFDAVNITYRQAYNKPEEIKSDLSLYRSITLQSESGQIERILIQFEQDKVSTIEKGSGLLYPITKWPENSSTENTIHVADPINEVPQKLLAIYQNPTYQNYKIILSDKWLQKAFDQDMSNYNQWYFAFNTQISNSRGGSSSVSLYFDNGKLSKIQHQYNEADVFD